MNKTIELRLGRGHKVIERLTRELGIRTSALSASLSPMRIQAPEGVSERVERRRGEVSNSLQEVAELRAALGVVRTAVAEKNSQVGIHVLLAKEAVLKGEVACLAELVQAADLDSGITLDSVQGAFERLATSGNYHMQPSVCIATQEQYADLSKQLEVARARLDAIGDEINDVNASAKIQVELSEKIAALIGL
jgi:hypothetical protein